MLYILVLITILTFLYGVRVGGVVSLGIVIWVGIQLYGGNDTSVELLVSAFGYLFVRLVLYLSIGFIGGYILKKYIITSSK